MVLFLSLKYDIPVPMVLTSQSWTGPYSLTRLIINPSSFFIIIYLFILNPKKSLSMWKSIELLELQSEHTVLRTVAGFSGLHRSFFYFYTILWLENKSQLVKNLNIKKKKKSKERKKTESHVTTITVNFPVVYWLSPPPIFFFSFLATLRPTSSS